MLQTHQVLQTCPLKALGLLMPVGCAVLHRQGAAGSALLPSHEPRTCGTNISCPSVAQATSLLPLHRALAVALQGNVFSKQIWNGFSLCEWKPWPSTLQLIPAQGLLRWSCCQQQPCGQIHSACSAVVVPAAAPAVTARSSLTASGAAPAWSRGPQHLTSPLPRQLHHPWCQQVTEGQLMPQNLRSAFFPCSEKFYLPDKNNDQAWGEFICKVLGHDEQKPFMCSIPTARDVRLSLTPLTQETSPWRTGRCLSLPLMDICSLLKCTLSHTLCSFSSTWCSETRTPFWGSGLVLSQCFLFPWLGDKPAAR